jgi:hypothetical protein
LLEIIWASFHWGQQKEEKGYSHIFTYFYISGQNGRLTGQSAKGWRHSPIFKKLEKLRLLKILGLLTQVKNPGASPEAFKNMNSPYDEKPKQASGYQTQRE